MSEKIKADFQDLFSTDDVLRKTNELLAEQRIFNAWTPQEKRKEYNNQLSQFIKVAKNTISERAEGLVDQQAAEQYLQIATFALDTTLESLQQLEIQKSETHQFEAIIEKFYNTLGAVEVATKRPRLELDRLQKSAEDIKHIVEA
jgi:hypothetical protein